MKRTLNLFRIRHLLPLCGLLLLTAGLAGCRDKNPHNWNDRQVEAWFATTPWASLSVALDSTSDKHQMAVQMAANPASWEAALKFMQETDFDSIPAGKYDLAQDGTYATVTDYTTRDSAAFEVHRDFIDLQYVSHGREYIDITTLKADQEYVQEYDPTRDIAFFHSESFGRVPVDSTRFLLLFPSDPHRPCMTIDTTGPVRKIVVKIPVAKTE